jgi:formylmethanofuran dehydrogenase subunit B
VLGAVVYGLNAPVALYLSNSQFPEIDHHSRFGYAVDFSLGYPRYNPGESSFVEILMRQEFDAVLAVAPDPVAGLPKNAVEKLVKNPLIVIDPHLSATSLMADVVFPSAIVGIEMEGTAYRMDRVPLPLKKVVQPPNGILSDEEILRKILEETNRIKSQISSALD